MYDPRLLVMFPFFAMSLFICFPLPHVWVPAIPIADKNLPLRGPGDCRWNDMVNHAVLLAVGIHVCSPGSPRDFKKTISEEILGCADYLLQILYRIVSGNQARLAGKCPLDR